MTGTTISGSYLTGFTISSADSPVYVTGTIAANPGPALYGIASGAPVVVVNYGLLTSDPGDNVIDLASGGTITNQAAGTITGGDYGVRFQNAAGTVTNAGSIGGGTDAVQFASSFANLLVVDPGASFSGIVDGGNPIGGLAISTLELAAGADVGTLTGLGSQYIDFAQITIDATASWTLASPAIAAGYTIIDAGTLTNTGSLGSGVTLAPGAVLTNALGATISSDIGVQGGPGTVFNAGEIDGTGAPGYGISLQGGAVTNEISGTISGTTGGVDFTGAGSVVNYGIITSDGTYGVALRGGGSVINGASGIAASPASIYGPSYGVFISGGLGTVTNYGTIASASCGCFTQLGVYLGAGGSVTNAQFGTISGFDAGILVTGASAAVLNAGTIEESSPFGQAVALLEGGSFQNELSGYVSAAGIGIAISGSVAGTVVNYGTINAQGQFGVGLLDGGSVINGASGPSAAPASIYSQGFGVFITGGEGTVTNYGTIASATCGCFTQEGVYLGAGGSVTNAQFGTISGYNFGIYVTGASGAVVNAGTIEASSFFGAAVALAGGGSFRNELSGYVGAAGIGVAISGSAAGTVTNYGTITAQGPFGVGLRYGGTVINGTSGSGPAPATIYGMGSGVVIYDAAGTITNYGTIAGSTCGCSDFGGVFLQYGGNVTNAASASIIGYRYGVGSYGALTTASTITISNSGTISGVHYGVYIGPHLTDATVVNAGTITGGVAAVFLTGTHDLLVATPDAVFEGIVLVVPGSDGTLELASGSSSGYLDGIGSNFINFTSITVDANATWLATGTFYGTLTNAGTLLTTTSLTLSQGTVINTGLLQAPFYIGADEQLTNQASGIITGDSGGGPGALVAAGATVVNSGLISNTNPDGTTFGVYFQASGSLTNTGTITGGSGIGAQIATQPLYIDNSGTVLSNAAGGYGIGLQDSGTVTNSGKIIASGTNGVGIEFKAGGTVSNLAGGTISGVAGGVYLFGSGNAIVDNAGLIEGTDTVAMAGGVTLNATSNTLINTGTITGTCDAVDLFAGGTLANGVDGSNSGYIMGLEYGVFVSSGLGSIVNYGVIKGIGAVGVELSDGGTIKNGATDSPGALIQGGALGVIAGGPLTLANYGTIEGTQPGSFGVDLIDDGVLTNGASNDTSALIQGNFYGVFAQGNATTLTNFGTINGTSGVQIIGATGTVTNYGIISGGMTPAPPGFYHFYRGIYLGGGGSVTNNSGGTITGLDGISAAGSATVVNYGIISGSMTPALPSYYHPYRGIDLGGGGSVTNHLGGTITGLYGISAAGSATVVNAGSIGGYDYAVALGAGGTIINQSGGIITGGPGLGADIWAGGEATVLNSGVIGTVSPGLEHYGIVLKDGGTVTNQSGGTIVESGSFRYGIRADNAAATVVNDGVLIGSGVRLKAGGSFTNQASGTIAGLNTGDYTVAVNISGGLGIVINAGTILGNLGIYVQAGGTVVNQSGGTIAAYGGAPAVYFKSGYTNLVVADPGAVFYSHVNGGNTVGSFWISTLELASGASVGTLDGLGSQFINFAQIVVDANAAWTLTGADTVVAGATLTELAGASVTDTGTFENDGNIVLDPSTLTVGALTGTGTVTIDAGSTLDVSGNVSVGETIAFASATGALQFGDPAHAAGLIAGFVTGDTIDLINITHHVTDRAILLAGDTLEVITTSGTFDFRMAGNFSGEYFHLTNNGSGGSDITVDATPCYCRGTLILTDKGEVAVEDLAIGDLVITLSGEAKPIKWIGRRGYNARFVAGNRRVQPILIRAGALQDAVPRRDLYVSPQHAMLLDDVLVPAEMLVNGATILRCDTAQTVEYFHIELDAHDVIIADGAPAETFVDCDNRGTFHNAHEFGRLYPGDAPAKRAFCAARVEDGDRLADIRRKLAERFAAFGYATIFDPDLRLMIDGQPVAPTSMDNFVYRFELTKPPGEARIVSRSSVPDDIKGGCADARRLGVNFHRIVLRNEHLQVVVDYRDVSLRDGFHRVEETHRWTDGNALIPPKFLACFEHALTVEVHLLNHPLPYLDHLQPNVGQVTDQSAQSATG